MVVSGAGAGDVVRDDESFERKLSRDFEPVVRPLLWPCRLAGGRCGVVPPVGTISVIEETSTAARNSVSESTRANDERDSLFSGNSSSPGPISLFSAASTQCSTFRFGASR